MKGPHDDKLEQSGHWPLRGTFTIELLNQLNDSDHYSPSAEIYEPIERIDRVNETRDFLLYRLHLRIYLMILSTNTMTIS